VVNGRNAHCGWRDSFCQPPLRQHQIRGSTATGDTRAILLMLCAAATAHALRPHSPLSTMSSPKARLSLLCALLIVRTASSVAHSQHDRTQHACSSGFPRHSSLQRYNNVTGHIPLFGDLLLSDYRVYAVINFKLVLHQGWHEAAWTFEKEGAQRRTGRCGPLREVAAVRAARSPKTRRPLPQRHASATFHPGCVMSMSPTRMRNGARAARMSTLLAAVWSCSAPPRLKMTSSPGLGARCTRSTRRATRRAWRATCPSRE